MKIELRDRDALRSLTPIEVRAYLESQSWKDLGSYRDRATIHGLKGNNREWEVILPVNRDLADYSERLAELISTLSEVEGRSELQIFSDLQLSGSDAVRFRAPHASVEGTIALENGVEIFEQVENVFLAAACAVTKPNRRVYRARKITEATKYLSTLRLGQTERGSYVVTVLSPVEASTITPVDELTSQQALALSTSSEEPHFGRVVVSRLAIALRAAHVAVEKAAIENDLRPFEQALFSGVNANLCDALAKLTDRGGGLDVSVSWARVRPTREGLFRVQFSADHAPMLADAAINFRQKQAQYDETLMGFVTHLDRGLNDFDGRAKLQVLWEGNWRSVRVEFSPPDFDRVIRAFQDRLLVAIDGDLHPVGQRYELKNPRDLIVLGNTDDNTSEPASD